MIVLGKGAFLPDQIGWLRDQGIYEVGSRPSEGIFIICYNGQNDYVVVDIFTRKIKSVINGKSKDYSLDTTGLSAILEVHRRYLELYREFARTGNNPDQISAIDEIDALIQKYIKGAITLEALIDELPDASVPPYGTQLLVASIV